MRQATAELATERAAQMRVTMRKPKTKAWEMDARSSAVVGASRLEGRSRPASLISLERTYWRMSGGSGTPARLRFKLPLNNFTKTIPRMATASTPATRATALLMPEAVPARAWSTELITTVVSGATLIAIQRPRTMNAGTNAFQ